MKLAVLGDIHSNLEAFEAVLADLDKQRPDRLFCVGDIVGYGPNPRECLALIRERGIETVQGNHDYYVANDDELSAFQPLAQTTIYWHKVVCNAKEQAFLRSLPWALSTNDVQVLHTPTIGENRWRYILDMPDIKAAFANTQGQIVFIGHTHRPGIYLDEEPILKIRKMSLTLPTDPRVLVNVGAVGQPRDGDPRACWCLYDSTRRHVQIRRCKYDHKKTAGKIRKAGLPARLARRLGLGK